MIEPSPNVNIRQWAVDSAVAINKKGTPISRIIQDSKAIYEFTNNIKCKLIPINTRKGIK